jgi:hypothetical protein
MWSDTSIQDIEKIPLTSISVHKESGEETDKLSKPKFHKDMPESMESYHAVVAIHKFFVNSLGEQAEKNSEYAKKILKEYSKSSVISSPKTLPPLYVTEMHTDESLKYMSAAYIQERDAEGGFDDKDKDIQLFEIPPIPLDCQGYCALGYKTIEEYTEIVENENRSTISYEEKWVPLPKASDFTCRPGFEKIFLYGRPSKGYSHYSRQWGDATYLSKHGGDSKEPFASVVWRVLSPQHPAITGIYGKVSAIWIRKIKNKIPAPFFRWQSIEEMSHIPGVGYGLSKENRINTPLDDPKFKNELFDESVKIRHQLRTKSKEDKLDYHALPISKTSFLAKPNNNNKSSGDDKNNPKRLTCNLL